MTSSFRFFFRGHRELVDGEIFVVDVTSPRPPPSLRFVAPRRDLTAVKSLVRFAAHSFLLLFFFVEIFFFWLYNGDGRVRFVLFSCSRDSPCVRFFFR